MVKDATPDVGAVANARHVSASVKRNCQRHAGSGPQGGGAILIQPAPSSELSLVLHIDDVNASGYLVLEVEYLTAF
jgi:hypothetical protein